MNLQQLIYFREIAQREHFTRAAEVLNISQPSLSHAISNLEDELQARLFVKDGRNVRLTKYGSIFLDYVEKSLEILEEGVDMVKSIASPNIGTITLSYFSSLTEFIPYLVSGYRSAFENNQTRFFLYQQTGLLIDECLFNTSADFAITSGAENPHLERIPLGEHELVVLVYADHPLSSRKSIALKELNGETFIMYDEHCFLHAQIGRLLNDANIEMRISYETNRDDIIMSFVGRGMGIAIVPHPLFALPSNLRVLKIEDKMEARMVYLAYHKDLYLSPSCREFLKYVHKSPLLLNQFRQGL